MCVYNERKRWTYSEKSPYLTLLHVCEIPVAACEIVASKWFATGTVWPKRIHGAALSGGGGGAMHLPAQACCVGKLVLLFGAGGGFNAHLHVALALPHADAVFRSAQIAL